MRIAAAAMASLLAVGMGASGATAGGWAVTTLDPLPVEPTAGSTTMIGWTIRQHGVAPVDFSTWGDVPDVALVIETPSETLGSSARPTVRRATSSPT
jgi:hypothetical protein